MKSKLYFVFLLILLSPALYSQLPEDALRYSWTAPSGTAREQAIGGAMGSLGGEISSLFVNPAGLGMYKTGEFVISPGFDFLGGKSNFRGTDAKANNFSRFSFGTTGFVWGYSDPYSRWNSKAFAIAVNRTASFNRSTYYKGQNDYSSFAEPLADEFANSGYTIDQALSYSSNLSLLTKMAIYDYLVDTATINGVTQVIARSEFPGLLNQEKSIRSTGGITEVSLGFAANMDDRLYIGASIGVPIVNYEQVSDYYEEDATGLTGNQFANARYMEDYTSRGAGFNARLGLIFRAAKALRFGLAIHTPTLYNLRETTSSTLTTDIEDKDAGGNPYSYTVSSATVYSAQNVDPEYKYSLQTPWRFLISGSLVLHQVEDVKQQNGFITADVEYVSHKGSRFSAADGYDDQYYSDLNQGVKTLYKGAFNFRVGGEMKFKTLMGRLGFAYYGNPYNDAALKANRMNISGGIGYRNKGIFVDLTYVYGIIKDVNFPYRVNAPRLNTFAELKDRAGTLLCTVGFKFG